MTIENIIETVKIGTQCKMDNTIYEVIDIEPYSEVCNTPQYAMKVIDAETIEERKQSLERYNKNNPRYTMTLEESLTMDRIEPMWFIARKAVILN
jgi:hypothetical protein